MICERDGVLRPQGKGDGGVFLLPFFSLAIGFLAHGRWH